MHKEPSSSYEAAEARSRHRLPQPMRLNSLAWAVLPLVGYIGLRVWRTNVSFPAWNLLTFTGYCVVLLAICFFALYGWFIYLPRKTLGWVRVALYAFSIVVSIGAIVFCRRQVMQPSLSTVRLYLVMPGALILCFLSLRLVALMKWLNGKTVTRQRPTVSDGVKRSYEEHDGTTIVVPAEPAFAHEFAPRHSMASEPSDAPPTQEQYYRELPDLSDLADALESTQHYRPVPG